MVSVLSDIDVVMRVVAECREESRERLPPERELAARLGLSRSRLRTAMQSLVDRGIIWREVGNGTYLGRRPLMTAKHVRAADLGSLVNPREVFETRLLIEPELARLAAMRAKSVHIEELSSCLEQMHRSTRVEDWARGDLRFHTTISDAAGNALLSMILATVHSNLNREHLGGLLDNLRARENVRASNADHARIAEAIQRRETDEAAAAMRRHIVRLSKLLFGE